MAGTDRRRPEPLPRSKRVLLPKPALVVREEPAWPGGPRRVAACIEARSRFETVVLALVASAAVQAMAVSVLMARCEGDPVLVVLGSLAFLPVALAPFAAARRDAGDCAVTTATVVAVLGGACNIGLALTVWFAAPPFGRPDPVMFAQHPGRDFLWSPFAGAGGVWFLSGLATLLVARASRPGGLPGSSLDSREGAAWWMNGLPAISLLAYGLALGLAGR